MLVEGIAKAARDVARVLLDDLVVHAVDVEVDPEVHEVLVVRSRDVLRDDRAIGVARRGVVGPNAAVEGRAGQSDLGIDAPVHPEDVVGVVDVVADPEAPGDHELAREASITDE